MGLRICVENRNHKRLREFNDDDEDTLLRIRDAALKERLLIGGMSAYGDTMFNDLQLRWLLEEIDGLEQTARSPAEKEMLALLAHAAHEAIACHGYLFVVGD